MRWKRESSLVVICEYCRSVVARGDRTIVEPLPWSGPSASVHVALDGSLVAHLRVIRIEPGVPPGATLMEQIP